MDFFVYRILQIATFTHSVLHTLFPWQMKPFASSPQKSVEIHWVEWMGLNFDDYPGFQPKMTHPKLFDPNV